MKNLSKIIIALTLGIFLHNCKGNGERVDLSKKTAKCNAVYEDQVEPYLLERIEVFSDLDSYYQSTASAVDPQKSYCELVESRMGQIPMEYMEGETCFKMVEQTLEPYGGCSQFSSEISEFCTDPSQLPLTRLVGFESQRLHPKNIITLCAPILEAAEVN